MNHFAFTKKIDSNEPQQVEFELSPEIAHLFIEPLKELYEIAIMQGEQNVLPNGMIQLKFSLDNESAEILKNYLMQAYTKHTGYNIGN